MKYSRLIIFFFLIYCVQFKLTAQENKYGSLLITSGPGFRIFLNNTFKGFTKTEQEGLFLDSLKIGSYTLKATKRGVEDIELKLEINNQETTEVSLYEFYNQILDNKETDITYIHIVFPTIISRVEIDFAINELVTKIKANDHIVIPKPYEGMYIIQIEDGLKPARFYTREGLDSYIRIKQSFDVFSMREISKQEFDKIMQRKNFNKRNIEL